jgi:RHS repeat-associated protein
LVGLDRVHADLDGDGASDLLVPDEVYRRDDGVGAVRVVRTDGAPVVQVASGQMDDRFGYDATLTPDMSGDGVPDVFVGAPLASRDGVETGRAYLFSGADGALLRHWDGDPHSRFGKSVAFVGDVNGDAVGDLAIGGFLLTSEGEPYGSVHLVSGADGAEFRTIVGEQIDDGFGGVIAGIGDANGDGVGDFMVSASLALNPSGTRGRVYAFAGGGAAPSHGAEDSLETIINPSLMDARFARWILPATDIDGDGETEVAIVSERGDAAVGITADVIAWQGVGAPITTFEGAIVVDPIDVPMAPGEVLLEVDADAMSAGMGRRLTAVGPAALTGDMNGDGAVDAADLDGLIDALSNGDLSGDMDGDGDLDAADLSRGLRGMLGMEAIDGDGADLGGAGGLDLPQQSLEGPGGEDPCEEQCYDCHQIPDGECDQEPGGGGDFPLVQGSDGFTDNRPPPDDESGEPPDDGDGESGGGGGGGGGGTVEDYLEREAMGPYAETHETVANCDILGAAGPGAATGNPVMLATGVKRELEADLVVSLPGRDFQLVRRYDSAMVDYKLHRPWTIGGGWATSADSWLEWKGSRFEALAADEYDEFEVLTGAFDGVTEEDKYDPTQAHIRITRFPDETGSLFLAPRDEGVNMDITLGYDPKYYTPYLPTAASVRKGHLSLGGRSFGVWVYERAGEGQVLFYNTADHGDAEVRALNGRVVHERDEFGNVWTYSYVVTTLASGEPDEPRVHRIYLNGTTLSNALAYVEFVYDEGASSATPGSGRLIEAKVHRKAGGDWHVTQYVRYTYVGDDPDYAHCGDDPNRLVLVESGVQVNAPAASEPSATPVYHTRVTHYRYSGDYLSHTYYPEQVEHYAERYAQSLSENNAENTQSIAMANAGRELAKLPFASGEISPGVTVESLASKIVTYYGDETAPGYEEGMLKGRVKSERLQNGCGCGGGDGQAVEIEFEYARRGLYDHQMEYAKLEQNPGGWLDPTTAIRPIRRWSRVTVRKEYAPGASGARELLRRTRTWSEDRLFGMGWVTYRRIDSGGPQAGQLEQVTYLNWLPVPVTTANEVTEFSADENGDPVEGKSWRSFFEFNGYYPTNSFGPAAVDDFETDGDGLLIYNGEYDPGVQNPANPVDAVSFHEGALVEWQEVDDLGRVLERGVGQVGDAATGAPTNLKQTHAVVYLEEHDDLDAGAGAAPRTDLVASEIQLDAGGVPALITTYEYDLVARSGMRRPSIAWMQTEQARESVAQLGPGDGLKVHQTVSYTLAGQAEFAQAPDGALTHTQYDAATGAPTAVEQNAVWSSGPPPPFLPDRAADGGTLTTTTTVDVLGRPIAQTDELGRTTTIAYGLQTARLHTGAPGAATPTLSDSRLQYLHVVTTPHSFVDASGATRYVGPETQEWGNAAYNTMQLSEFVAGAGPAEERARTLHTYGRSGKLRETRVWHDLDDEQNGSHASVFHYDSLGRESGVTDPNGETITRIFDVRDRVTERRRSVNDAPGEEEVLERIYYDYPIGSGPPEQGVGDGNATLVETILADSGDVQVRRSVTVFDWRNRPRLQYTAAASGGTLADPAALLTADSGSYTATIFDQLDRPVEQAVVSGGDMQGLASDLSEDLLSSFADYLNGNPIPPNPAVERITAIAYGARGLPYRSTTFVYPDGYSAGVAQESRTWYDENGRVLVSAGERGPVTKTEYDGLGRAVLTAVTDGQSVRVADPAFGSATAIDLSDTAPERVYETARTVYLGPLPLRVESAVRAHDAVDMGLGAGAITTYADTVYDAAGRPVAQVSHGTGSPNFGASVQPLIVVEATIPDIADPGTIVTRLRYDDLGRNHETVDPLGRVTRTYFDDLGRVIGTIVNVKDGAAPIDIALDQEDDWAVVNRPDPDATDENLATTMAYDGAGNIIRRTAHEPDGGRQTTEYIYDRSVRSSNDPHVIHDFDNPPLSNNLLYEVRYPGTESWHNSGDYLDGNTVLFAYNRAGEQVAMLDQDGVRRTQTRDASGRIVSELAWSVYSSSPFDLHANEIVTEFDRFGRMALAETQSDTGLVNRLTYTRDALGRITAITHQPRTEEAPTWQIGYEYEPFSSETPVSRLAAMVYATESAPGAPTRIEYDYGAAGSSDDLLSRLVGFSWWNDPFLGAQAATHAYVGLTRRVMTSYESAGAAVMQRDRWTDPDTGAADPGVYRGLDRFGRVARNNWSVGQFDPGNRPPLLDAAYVYDDAGNILAREDGRLGVLPPAAHEYYGYDDLDRLTDAYRGDAAIPGVRSEQWSLDALGNWTTHTIEEDGDGAFGAPETRSREHNETNEIEKIIDGAGVELEFDHDRRGAISAEPLPPVLDASGAVIEHRRRQHIRDLFGRLVRIVEQSRPDTASPWANGATVTEYTYYAGNQLATRKADEDGDGVLETLTVYLYDADWNLLEEIIFVDEANPTTANNDFVRQSIWDPTSTNELVQTRFMQRDSGTGVYSIPFPIWAATDRRRDVVALHYNFGSGAMGHTRVRYSAYGVPEPVLTGDLNHDGLLNNDDRVELALIRASEPTGVVTMPDLDWTPDADLNFDGAIDETDASMLTNLVNAGASPSEVGDLWGQGGTSAWRGVAIGYAGMLYDRQAGAFLMRNRWHSPTLGRFLSRDPAGYVDGMSLYAYVSGNPLKYWDPFGLAECSADYFQDLRIRRLLKGEITKAEFREEEIAAANGALLGIALLPGSQAALGGALLRGAVGAAVLGRAGATAVSAMARGAIATSRAAGALGLKAGAATTRVAGNLGRQGGAAATQAVRFAGQQGLAAGSRVANLFTRTPQRAANELAETPQVYSTILSPRGNPAAEAVRTTRATAKDGHSGRRARLRELADDLNLSSADRGWIRQELNQIKRGTRRSIRNPPGKILAHPRGREAAKGYNHTAAPSELQDIMLHRIQHKYDNFGRRNARRE